MANPRQRNTSAQDEERQEVTIKKFIIVASSVFFLAFLVQIVGHAQKPQNVSVVTVPAAATAPAEIVPPRPPPAAISRDAALKSCVYGLTSGRSSEYGQAYATKICVARIARDEASCVRTIIETRLRMARIVPDLVKSRHNDDADRQEIVDICAADSARVEAALSATTK